MMNQFLRLLIIIQTLTNIGVIFGYNNYGQQTPTGTPAIPQSNTTANAALFNGIGGFGWGNVSFSGSSGSQDPFGFATEDIDFTDTPASNAN